MRAHHILTRGTSHRPTLGTLSSDQVFPLTGTINADDGPTGQRMPEAFAAATIPAYRSPLSLIVRSCVS